MPNITKFDRKTCEALSTECVAALQEIAAKYGLNVIRGGGKFGEAEYTMHLKFAVTDVSAREAAERKLWDASCRYLDLTPEDYGAEFTTSGKTFKAVGFSNSAKFPISARDVANGQMTRFSDVVIQIIKAKRK